LAGIGCRGESLVDDGPIRIGSTYLSDFILILIIIPNTLEKYPLSFTFYTFFTHFPSQMFGSLSPLWIMI